MISIIDQFFSHNFFNAAVGKCFLKRVKNSTGQGSRRITEKQITQTILNNHLK